MPTPMPIIATIAVVKLGMAIGLLSSVTIAVAQAEAEQGGADRQTHRQHRAEGDDQDDDGGKDAVDLALRKLELGEQVAAVLDLDAFDRREPVSGVADLLAVFDQLLERAIGNVELHEGDRCGFSNLNRVDGDPFDIIGDRDQLLKCSWTSGSSMPCSALMTIEPEKAARSGSTSSNVSWTSRAHRSAARTGCANRIRHLGRCR